MKELVERLTENGKYASEICLLLCMNNQDNTLHYLDYLDIKGKKLEVLYYDCCFEQSVQCLVETTRYLMSGFISKDTIHENVDSNHPVNFIDRLLKKGDDWDSVYEQYTEKFHRNREKGRLR